MTELIEDDNLRAQFLVACLKKLGLTVNDHENPVPSLSRLHVSSLQSSDVSGLLETLKDIVVDEDGEDYIKGENDTFRLHKPSTWSTSTLAHALESISKQDTDQGPLDSDRILDYSEMVKHVVFHPDEYPSSKETVSFNHHAFYSNLKFYQGLFNVPGTFGKYIMYGEVVTSTSSMLEKYGHPQSKNKSSSSSIFTETCSRNPKLLRRLPTGFTATANVQIAGRGRGSNVWVSPAGSLMFSIAIRHPADVANRAPVVFVQYIASLAIVEGIKSYDIGYRNLPIKLKWPNDICKRVPFCRASGVWRLALVPRPLVLTANASQTPRTRTSRARSRTSRLPVSWSIRAIS